MPFVRYLVLNLKFGIREKTLLLMNYLFPIGFYLIIGGIMPNLNKNTDNSIIPAMMVFAVIVSTILGMPNDITSSRRDGIFRSYKINGIGKSKILFAPVLSTAIHSIVVSAIVIITAPILFKVDNIYSIFSLVISFLCCYVACSGIALVISSISDNASISILLAQIIFLPSMLIGGIMLPTGQLSSNLKTIGQLLPSTYAMDLVNGLNKSSTALNDNWVNILVLLSTGVIAYILAHILFRYDCSEKPKLRLISLFALLPSVLFIVLTFSW